MTMKQKAPYILKKKIRASLYLLIMYCILKHGTYI